MITDVRDLHYIDAMPGAGKTQFFVHHAARLLNTPDPEVVLVYAAPTIDLLVETAKRLLEACDNPSAMKRRLFLAVSKKHRAEFKSIPHYPMGDQPATALNFLLGLIDRQSYLDSKYRSGSVHTLKAEARVGDVILTTHEAFVRVNRQDTTGRDYGLMSKTVVVFDEARRCVLKPRRLNVPKDQWINLFKSMTKVVEGSEDPKFRKSQGQAPMNLPRHGSYWNLFRVDSIADVNTLKTTFGAKTVSMLPQPVRDLRSMYREFVQTGRGALFLLCNSTISDEHHPDLSSDSSVTVQIVMRPTALFMKYKQVILTSAFFEDSQMYHLLKKDGHTLINMMDQSRLSPSLKSIKARSTALRRSASARLHVSALLKSEPNSNSPGSYRENLTSTLLSNGMVISTKLAGQIAGRVRSDLSHSEAIHALTDRSEPVTDSEELDQRLRNFAVPPLWVLIYRASQIFESWSSQHLTPNARSLLITNVGIDREWAPTGVRFINVVRTILARGTLREKSGHSGSQMMDGRHRRDADQLDPNWERVLRRILYDKNEDSMFTLTVSTHLHGINAFSHLSAFTHLAALNPSPSLHRVYSLLIEDYDVDKDHSIENLVQTLYRTSLRDPHAKGPVLMIVPFSTAVDLLAEKIGVKHFKWAESPNLVVFSHRKKVDKPTQLRRSRAISDANRQYSPEFADEILKLRSRVKTTRHRLKKDPNSEVLKKALTQHEKAFHHLQEQAKIKK